MGKAIRGRRDKVVLATKFGVVRPMTRRRVGSLEVMYPYRRLKEEGYEVHIAAPSKKKLHFVVRDFEPG